MSREQGVNAGLEQLSPVFAEAARVGYDFAQATYDDIPREDSPVPKPGKFASYMGLLALLEPYYNKMERNGWEPVVEFYSEGLSFNQANHLLEGHDLSDGSQSYGIVCNWERYWNKMQDPTAKVKVQDQESPGVKTPLVAWDISVTSNADKPPLTRVSADGFFGSRAAYAIENLQDLFDISDPPVNDQQRRLLVAQANPSASAYNMLQLRRLKQGQRPLDYPEDEKRTTSFLKEVVCLATGGVSSNVAAYWHGKKQGVGIGVTKFDRENRDTGIRPSVRARDLLLPQ